MLSPKWLIHIDNLVRIPYGIFLYLFVKFRKKKHIIDDGKTIVIKMMGIGSITRIYRSLKENQVDFDKVLFVTLASNKKLFEALNISKVKYLKDKNLFVLSLELIRFFFFIRRTLPNSVINFERGSNLLGVFQIISTWFTSIRIVSFHDYQKEIYTPSDHIYSIHGQSFQDLIDKTYDFFGKHQTRHESALKEAKIDSKKVLININASDYMPYRKYPPSQFAAVIRSLHNWDNELYFELVGSAQEKDYVEQLVSEVKSDKLAVCNRCGEWEISDLMEELSTCGLFVTNDSGPMHLGALVNIPMIVIWGPTSSELFGYHTDLITNIQTREACSPCFKYAKSKAAVVCDKRIDCLTSILPDRIVTAAKNKLTEVKFIRKVNYLANQQDHSLVI